MLNLFLLSVFSLQPVRLKASSGLYRNKLTFWLMSDNCLNIFPRSTRSIYLFTHKRINFHPRALLEENTYFTYNIIIIIIVADLSRCYGKKYSHLYLMSFSFHTARQEIFCLISHRIMFTFNAGEFHALSPTLFITFNVVRCFSFFHCNIQHENIAQSPHVSPISRCSSTLNGCKSLFVRLFFCD